MSLNIVTEEATPSGKKKWDMQTWRILSLSENTWGINASLVPQLITLMKDKNIARFQEGENTISYPNLKKLVAFLYAENFDTSDLNLATEAFINREGKAKAAAEETGQRKLNPELQNTLSRFIGLVASPVQADGQWGRASQKALAAVQQFYNLPAEGPSPQVLNRLQLILSRLPAIKFADENASRYLERTKFAVKATTGKNLFELAISETTGSLEKAGKEIIHFPNLSGSDPSPVDAFAACLLVLQLHAQKPPDDFCDLLLLKDEERWQTPDEFPCKNKKDFYYRPEHALGFQDRTRVSFTIRYIPKTNYAIEVIGFYLTGSMAMAATMGEDVDDKEIGKERLFDAGLYFHHFNTDKAEDEVAVHTKADFIKLFIVRKNRKEWVQAITNQPPGYSMPLEFYQLLTADDQDILATACFGINFLSLAEDGLSEKQQEVSRIQDSVNISQTGNRPPRADSEATEA